jgi:hypothetical protein
MTVRRSAVVVAVAFFITLHGGPPSFALGKDDKDHHCSA